MYRLVKLGIFPLLLFLCFQTPLLFAQNPVGNTIAISMKIDVEWEDTTQNSDGFDLYKTFGSYHIEIMGFMKTDDLHVPEVSRNNMTVTPYVFYYPFVLDVAYTYYEEWQELRSDPYRICDNTLIEKYQGSHQRKVSSSSQLSICTLASVSESLMQSISSAEMQYAEKLKSRSTSINDYYQLAIGGGDLSEIPSGEMPVKGIRRNSDCSYEEVEKRYPGFKIGIKMKLLRSGIMQGSEEWKSDGDGVFPPTFGIAISDMNQEGESILNPPAGGKQNVTYAVEWKLGD